jgi:hypothetical protein
MEEIQIETLSISEEEIDSMSQDELVIQSTTNPNPDTQNNNNASTHTTQAQLANVQPDIRRILIVRRNVVLLSFWRYQIV